MNRLWLLALSMSATALPPTTLSAASLEFVWSTQVPNGVGRFRTTEVGPSAVLTGNRVAFFTSIRGLAGPRAVVISPAASSGAADAWVEIVLQHYRSEEELRSATSLDAHGIPDIGNSPLDTVSVMTGSGDELWVVGSSMTAVNESLDIGRDIAVRRMGPGGSVLWKRVFHFEPLPTTGDAPPPTWVVTDAAVAPSGGIYIAGVHFGGPRFLAHVGEDGELAWQRTFGGAFDPRLLWTTLSVTPEGTLVAQAVEYSLDYPGRLPRLMSWLFTGDGVLAIHADLGLEVDSGAIYPQSGLLDSVMSDGSVFALTRGGRVFAVTRSTPSGRPVWTATVPLEAGLCELYLVANAVDAVIICGEPSDQPGTVVFVDKEGGAVRTSSLERLAPCGGAEHTLRPLQGDEDEILVLGLSDEVFEVAGRYTYRSMTCAWLARFIDN